MGQEQVVEEVVGSGRKVPVHGQGGESGRELLCTLEVVHWCLPMGHVSVEEKWWGWECLYL